MLELTSDQDARSILEHDDETVPASTHHAPHVGSVHRQIASKLCHQMSWAMGAHPPSSLEYRDRDTGQDERH